MSASVLLSALGHPDAAGLLSRGDAGAATAVAWLEDSAVRALPPSERGPLRDVAAPGWPAAFQAFLERLECPLPAEPRAAALGWLLSHAVGLEYHDKAEQYAPADGDDAGCDEDAALPDIADPPVWSALASAAASLRVPWPAAGDNNPADGPPEGAAELAEALAAACQRLAWLAQLPPDERGAVAAAAGGAATADGAFPPGFEPPKPEPIAGGGDAGGDAGGDDPGGARAALLARACALLRCSHVAGLRRLQSRCDAALVAAQECTAQPRTDARLARTGR